MCVCTHLVDSTVHHRITSEGIIPACERSTVPWPPCVRPFLLAWCDAWPKAKRRVLDRGHTPLHTSCRLNVDMPAGRNFPGTRSSLSGDGVLPCQPLLFVSLRANGTLVVYAPYERSVHSSSRRQEHSAITSPLAASTRQWCQY